MRCHRNTPPPFYAEHATLSKSFPHAFLDQSHTDIKPHHTGSRLSTALFLYPLMTILRLFYLRVKMSYSSGAIVTPKIVLTASHKAKGSCCSYGESDAIIKRAPMRRCGATSNNRSNTTTISQVIIGGLYNLLMHQRRYYHVTTNARHYIHLY
jgi:hypothetical protein